MANSRYTNRDLVGLPGAGMLDHIGIPDCFESNGVSCGPDWILLPCLKWLSVIPVPWLRWVCLLHPAHGHDWDYTTPGTERQRLRADLKYYVRCRRVGLTGIFGRRFNRSMFYRLRLWGHRNYTYKSGHKPKKDMSFWVTLFFGRYKRLGGPAQFILFKGVRYEQTSRQ